MFDGSEDGFKAIHSETFADVLDMSFQDPTKAWEPDVHMNVICDGCDAEPIVGTRYRCLTKTNFDLCSKCYFERGGIADTGETEDGHRFEIVALSAHVDATASVHTAE